MDNQFTQINVLVIDTNSSLRQIMISMLRVLGVRNIIIANSVKQSIDIVASETIHLIICGWALPKLDALVLLKSIRNTDKSLNLPMIIVSTIIEQEKINQAIQNGVSEYLVPPFNQKIFLEKITKALKFPVKLSAKNIATVLRHKKNNKAQQSSGLSVLIVDDIADNIEIIKEVLKGKYKIKAALNAKSAMKICLSESAPDLILLDIMMPEVNGLTLCKALKNNPLTHDIDIIFITALSENKDVVKGLKLGAVDYITKPIVPEILAARVNVHATLLLNRYAIQKQIDHLLEQGNRADQYNHRMQKDIHTLLKIGSEQIRYLKPLKAMHKYQKELETLQYSINLADVITLSTPLLEQLNNDQYERTFKKLSLAELILPTVEMFTALIKRNNLEPFEKLDFNGYVKTDGFLFKLLFVHLYRNAVEASPHGSRVSVEINQLEGFVLVKIHNSGRIDEDIENKMEQLFISSKQEIGCGIGLTLSYLIIKKLNGDLFYHSSESYGTTFYIRLKYN